MKEENINARRQRRCMITEKFSSFFIIKLNVFAKTKNSKEYVPHTNTSASVLSSINDRYLQSSGKRIR